MTLTQIKNEPFSALTHFIGLLLAIAGLTLMIIFAALKGTASHVVGFTIFGSSLILVYTASTIYHSFKKNTRRKQIWQRIDHAMIYILIAGTYTPLCLAIPNRGWGWSLFGVIWGLALIGVILKSSGQMIHGWVSTSLYVLMGWLVLIAIYPLVDWLSTGALFWLVTGGLLYTIGAVIYAFDKPEEFTGYFGLHEVFHLFVMAGSFSHFWFMFRYVLHA